MMPTRELPGFHPTHFVVHYDEIGLKGKNRVRFEDRLVNNLRAALRDVGPVRIRRLYGRIAVELSEETSSREVGKRLRRVFGVAYSMPTIVTEPSLDALKGATTRALDGAPPSRSFAVKCRRADKEFPHNSMDVQRDLGAHIQKLTGWRVHLDAPEVTFRVEIVNDTVFLGFGRIPGPGGLPTGVAGRVVCLLSGGIDSPVAAYRLQRRGAVASYVHFHSHPHTNRESIEKVRELACRVQSLGLTGRLYEIPFAPLQREIVASTPEALRVILYRRFMLRAAAAIAQRERALALVTGESLGQVASQTLENLSTIDAVSPIPVLRPLIGMDKVEIIDEAKRVGTFELSIEPHDDCCSFLMPANPATRSRVTDLERAESAFDVAAETAKLLEAAEVLSVGPRGVQSIDTKPSSGEKSAAEGDGTASHQATGSA